MGTYFDYSMDRNVKDFSNMIGRTMVSVTGDVGEESMTFTADDGSTFTFDHQHDCCESVDIENIDGDLSDLLHSPILMAEEVSGVEPEFKDYTPESYTWTFYKFATARGYVTVRWLGQSNGYYGESVHYVEKLAA